VQIARLVNTLELHCPFHLPNPGTTPFAGCAEKIRFIDIDAPESFGMVHLVASER
jgi:hypothetical protein